MPVTGAQSSPYLPGDSWQIALGYRYLYSHRHFVGTDEQEDRRDSEVRNKVHLLDLSLTYIATERFSFSLSIPYQMAERSQINANPPVGERNHTEARGVGDITFIVRSWVLTPSENPNGNFSLGLGIKLPTGDASVDDSFKTATGVVVRTADQSIQPGDGGFGFIVDGQFFYRIGPVVPYASGTYLLNPRTTNHVLTGRARQGEQVMSVPDQYLVRGGIAVAVPWFEDLGNLGASLGVRLEGIPVRDLWGKSTGFRRPGYAFSIEPGIQYSYGRHTLSASVPVALVRERQRSVSDRDNNIHGDAAFADYLLLFGYAFRFGGDSAPVAGTGVPTPGRGFVP